MPRNLVSNIYAGIKDLLGPSVIDGHLNHVHLALATQCYWTQSRIFCIPDRFGFFSPGPPRLQAEESALFIIVVFFIRPDGLLWRNRHFPRLPGRRSAGQVVCGIGVPTHNDCGGRHLGYFVLQLPPRPGLRLEGLEGADGVMPSWWPAVDRVLRQQLIATDTTSTVGVLRIDESERSQQRVASRPVSICCLCRHLSREIIVQKGCQTKPRNHFIIGGGGRLIFPRTELRCSVCARVPHFRPY